MTQNNQNFIGYYSPTNEIVTSENGLFTSNFYSYSPPKMNYLSSLTSNPYTSSFSYYSTSSNESSDYVELMPSMETLNAVQVRKVEETSLNLDITSMFSIPADDYIKTFVEQHQEELIIPLIKNELSCKRVPCCECCKKKTPKRKTKAVETKKAKEPVECSVCKKIFRAQWYLKQHLKVYHLNEIKSFKCKKCGKCFSTLNELEVHAIKHSAVNQYKCNECPKSFVHKQDLKRHQYNHSIKPFPCKMCPKRFARKDALISHELSCAKKIKKQCDQSEKSCKPTKKKK